MTSEFVGKEIDNIQTRVNEIHKNTHRLLIAIILVFALFFVIQFLAEYFVPSYLYTINVVTLGWLHTRHFRLVLLAIFFLSLSVYFTLLLRNPQFTVLYINKRGSSTSTVDNPPKPKRRGKMTPAGVFCLIYFTINTVSWVGFIQNSEVILQLPKARALFFTFAALSYLPLFPYFFLLRHQKSTELRYTVPVFYGFYLGAISMILAPLSLMAAVELAQVATVDWTSIFAKCLIYSFFLPVILVGFLMGTRVLSSVQCRTDKITDNISEKFLQDHSVAEGVAIFPRSVPVDRSYNVMIDLDLSKYTCGDAANNEDECCRQLEVEIQAAGITVDGKKRLQLCKDSPLPVSIWNCYFPSTGQYTVNTILREVSSPPNNTRKVIFVHKTDVNVYGLFVGSAQVFLTLVISTITALTSLSALISRTGALSSLSTLINHLLGFS